MTQKHYLLAIAIGPVQDFIAASRKARDLDAGSRLLSELCKAAAETLRDQQHDDGTPVNVLIFPTVESLEEGHAVANKLLISTTGKPNEVAEAAQDAVQAKLIDLWDSETGRDAHDMRTIEVRIDEIWSREGARDQPKGVKLARHQLCDFIEFYAAWVPYGGPGQKNYEQARTRVEHLLAGRKALRDFAPAPTLPSRPKSSLDPSRESVITEAQQENADVQSMLHLSENEYLDAVSLLKRFYGNTRFVSTARVAMDPFIRAASEAKATEALDALGKASKILVKTKTELAEWFKPEGDLERFAAYPYDCQLIYDSESAANSQLRRWADKAGCAQLGRWAKKEGYASGDVLRADAEGAATRVVAEVGRLKGAIAEARGGESFGEVPTYYAVLLADGDKMGAAIGKLKSAEEHRALSTQLGTFAAEAGEIVRKHFGAMIYSGGDDVLAFLPLDTALPCADALHCAFNDMIGKAEREIAKVRGVDAFSFAANDGTTPTLSVGLAIGHYSEHLQAMLARARAAEREAKKKRNSLAVSFGSRSGGGDIRMVSHSWADEPLVKCWAPAIEGHRHDTFPDGAAYELEALHLQWRETYFDRQGTLRDRIADLEVEEQRIVPVLRAEVRRILARKQARAATEEQKAARIDGIVTRLEARTTLRDTLGELRALVDELIIARRIAPLLADDASDAVTMWNARHPGILGFRKRPSSTTATSNTTQEGGIHADPA